MLSDSRVLGRRYDEWLVTHPLLDRIVALDEVAWINPAVAPVQEVPDLDIGASDVAEASARLSRFAPYIARAFPETEASGGIIESPLQRIGALPRADGAASAPIWMKCDNELPISGSIKARGGIYEVLAYAEKLAIDAGLINPDARTAAPGAGSPGCTSDYTRFAEPEFREFFSGYSIAVGSTGNLGLSIGIMGARLGFSVTVHMSADAREWKKRLLRSRGVTVIEYEDDYSAAVAEGRRQAAADDRCHFVDDENSVTLFMGYAVAAERLVAQMAHEGIVVDAEHPLAVYLPCGVGGGPGGVAFGLKLALGDAVRCYFVEPTHAPAMLLGLYTGLHNDVCVQDFGIDNCTAADGLAVGRPSGFVGSRMHRLIDGVFTVSDTTMYRELARIFRDYGASLEPSAAAGLSGPERVTAATDDALSGATHLVWATGGSMVPAEEMERYRDTGNQLLGATPAGDSPPRSST